MEKLKRFLSKLPHPVRWIVIMVLGFLSLIFGILILPTPAPGLLFIFLGLSILALEIKWAQELNKQGMQILERTLARIKKIFKRDKK